MAFEPSLPPLRIIHTVPALRMRDGGSYSAVMQICELLNEPGGKVDLLTCYDGGTEPIFEIRNGVSIWQFPTPGWGSAFGWSPSLAAAVERLSGNADLMHVHGLWRQSGIAALNAARRRRVPAVVSPMGAFAAPALANARLRKRAYWAAVQKRALRDVACYHATSEAERSNMREFGIQAPIAVIPLGVPIPDKQEPPPSGEGRTLLFLGRITPIKNLVGLLGAWRSVQADFPEARLRIVGPDDRGYVCTVRNAMQELGTERVSLEDGVWGEARNALYRASDVVILPSLVESFGLVAAEALAAGRPVIATTGTPWSMLEEQGCGWWVDPAPSALASAMAGALATPPEELAYMGRCGRALIEREFSLPGMRCRFARLYQWSIYGGDQPDFVCN